MSIIQGITDSFCTELLNGVHDLSLDTLKIALYSSSASLGPTTTAYTTSGEVVGTGYVAGGAALTPTVTYATHPSSGRRVAIVDFADVSWPASTITAKGALIYNSSQSNRAIMVLSFGTERSTSNASFPIVFPSPTYRDALIRLGGS